MLFIIYPDVDIWNYVFDGGVSHNDYYAMPLNRNCAKWQLAIRKLFPSQVSRLHLLFGDNVCMRLNSLKDGDSLLICDYTDLCLIKTIAKYLNPSVRKYLWLWNPINSIELNQFRQKRNLISESGFEICTFDERNAQEFGMRLLPQFSKIPTIEEVSSIEHDFYFLGFEKGRRYILEQLRNELKGFDVDFKVVTNKKEIISYYDNINRINKSKCLVDIVQEGQTGLTLRPLEAMYMKKKLLTNNKDIRLMDFYSPNNIFVYGDDDISTIHTFLKKTFEELPQDVLDKYSFDSWIQNFY